MNSPDDTVSETCLPSADSRASAQPVQTELHKFRLRLEDDLKTAECVLRSMIPTSERRGNLEVVTDFRPTVGVGGDYASVHFQSDQRVVVGICVKGGAKLDHGGGVKLDHLAAGRSS